MELIDILLEMMEEIENKKQSPIDWNKIKISPNCTFRKYNGDYE